MFEHIAQRLRPRLMALARQLLHDPASAEDAVQDTLLRLWEARRTEPTADGLERLAFAILRHRCIDLRRTRHVTSPLDDAPQRHVVARERSDTPSEEADNSRWLAQRIARLPEKQRRLWKMKQDDGLSTAQIAAIAGLSEHTVQNTISQVRHQLAQELLKRNRR